MKLFLFSLLCISCWHVSFSVIEEHPFRLICYIDRTSLFKEALGIKYLNPNLCTHLIYGFLTDFKEDLSKQTNKILSMKKVNTKLKVMASIQVEGFTKTVSKNTINQVVDYIKMNSFDGLDIFIDKSVTFNSNSLIALLQATQEAFKKDGLLLSVAAGFSDDNEEDLNVMAQKIENFFLPMSQAVDFFNALFYGFENFRRSEADFTAPLYRADSSLFSVDRLVLSLLEHDISAKKINLGIPLSGSSWEIDSSITDTNPPVKAFIERPTSNFTGSEGGVSYHEICYNLRNPTGWKKMTTGDNKTYAISPPSLGSKRRIWVSYDDHITVVIKSEYIRKVRLLGGAMVFDLSQDDYLNHCGEGLYPLTRAISLTLGISSSSIPSLCGLSIILLTGTLSLFNGFMTGF